MTKRGDDYGHNNWTVHFGWYQCIPKASNGTSFA